MKFIEHLEGVVSSRLELAKGTWALVKLEAKLTRMNVVPLLISVGAMAALLITTWLTVMLLIGYLVIVFTGGYILVGIITVLLINICLFVYASKYIITVIKRMSFAKTRACLSNNKRKDANEFPE